MNISQLKDAIELAFQRGIDPETEVVIGGDPLTSMDWARISIIHDPSHPDNDLNGFIWFTLVASDEEADCRFNIGHYPPE